MALDWDEQMTTFFAAELDDTPEDAGAAQSGDAETALRPGEARMSTGKNSSSVMCPLHMIPREKGFWIAQEIANFLTRDIMVMGGFYAPRNEQETGRLGKVPPQWSRQ
jgi:hypothetical protein